MTVSQPNGLKFFSAGSAYSAVKRLFYELLKFGRHSKKLSAAGGQRRKWTFYEAVNLVWPVSLLSFAI
jgi:hypothetical protein